MAPWAVEQMGVKDVLLDVNDIPKGASNPQKMNQTHLCEQARTSKLQTSPMDTKARCLVALFQDTLMPTLKSHMGQAPSSLTPGPEQEDLKEILYPEGGVVVDKLDKEQGQPLSGKLHVCQWVKLIGMDQALHSHIYYRGKRLSLFP